MKKAILGLLMFACTHIVFAQSERYVSAMKKNISMMDSAIQKGLWSDLSNNFERIAEAEKTEWLPFYYAAYCAVMSALTEKDRTKTDAIADRAELLIAKAEVAAGKENSETAVIRSMIANAHMMVDPQARWMQYGKTSTENMKKAMEMDPTNPRPVLLEGQSKFFTPEAFGGGKAPAKESLIKALAMFETFKPQTELHPAWGKTTTEYFLAQCN